MTQGKKTATTRARLEQVLDIYGADPARWPASDREALEVLIEAQPNARKLHDEALALERVMAVAPALNASDALKERIVAAAVKDTERAARVVPVTAAAGSPGTSLSVQRSTLVWPAAALAASFAFGLYLGFAGIGAQTFDGALQIAAINGSAGDAESISWLDDGAGAEAEDLL